MGAGIQRWWSNWSREREVAEYDQRTKPEGMFFAPGARERLASILEDTFIGPPLNVRRVGKRDVIFDSPQCMHFSKVTAPHEITSAASIDCGDRETAEALLAMMNAPPDPARARSGKSMLMQQAAEAACERGERVVITGPHGTIEVVADKRVGDERYLFTRDAVWKVEKETNVAKDPVVTIDVRKIQEGDALWLEGVKFVAMPLGGELGGEMVGKKFVDTMHRIMEATKKGAYSDTDFAERVEHLLQLERGDVETLVDLAEVAWGIIANANGGDWSKASAEWREAAGRWRDRYHALLNVRARQVIEIRDGKCTSCGLFTHAGHEPGTCPGKKFETVRALDAAGFIPKAMGLAKILGEAPNPDHSFQFPLPTGEEAIRQGFCYAGGPPMPGEPGRAGDQLRKCHGCDKEQKVDDFNLSIAPHMSSGCFGDAEDLYVCDACAPDVLKAVRRVREGKAPARSEPHDIDLIAGDA